MDKVEHALAQLETSIEVVEHHLALMKTQLYLLKNADSVTHTELYLNSEQVCEYLGVGRNTLSRYRNGKTPSGKPPFPAPVKNSHYRRKYRLCDIEAWKEA